MQHVKTWYNIFHDDVALLHEPVNIPCIATEAFCHYSHAIDGKIKVFFLNFLFLQLIIRRRVNSILFAMPYIFIIKIKCRVGSII